MGGLGADAGEAGEDATGTGGDALNETASTMLGTDGDDIIGGTGESDTIAAGSGATPGRSNSSFLSW